jgi:hypothetical protein
MLRLRAAAAKRLLRLLPELLARGDARMPNRGVLRHLPLPLPLARRYALMPNHGVLRRRPLTRRRRHLRRPTRAGASRGPRLRWTRWRLW